MGRKPPGSDDSWDTTPSRSYLHHKHSGEPRRRRHSAEFPAWAGVVALAVVAGGFAAVGVGLAMAHKRNSTQAAEIPVLTGQAKAPSVPIARLPAVTDVASYCATHLPANLEVELTTARVKEDFSEGIRELTAGREEYHKNWYTLGLTHGQYATTVAYSISSLRVPGTSVTCYRPNIKFTVGLSKHLVQVGQELRSDSCGFAVVLAHEYRHVKVNEDAAQNARDTLESELRHHYAQSIFYDRFAAQNVIASDISTHWSPRLNQLIRTGLLAHKNVDTPQEYASNSTVCGGEIPRRMREAGVSVQYKPSEM